MKMFQLASCFGLTLFILMGYRLAAIRHTVNYSAAQATMPSPTVNIKQVTLIAREERGLTPGSPPKPDRDIGFASVFLKIENLKEENISLTIESIQIVNVENGKVQMSSLAAQEMLLRPLENSETAFYLSNRTGYADRGLVKAIVTYQIGDQLQVIESDPVEITRY